jgi:hypothetical protein
MKRTLAQLFGEAKGPTVEYEGRTVHGVVFRHVNRAGTFVIRFIKAVPVPLQALRIRIDSGKLFVENSESAQILLRLDTAPGVVNVRYQPSPMGGRISFYNAWINEDGGVDAWLVNAGMLVEETANKMILRCSDGRGEPAFDDLIVEIEFLDN